MADLTSIQRTLQRELRKTTRTKPLFLETRGSVWSSTKLPIAFFALYALLIYALNNAGLGELLDTMGDSHTADSVFSAPNFGRGASSLSAVLSMTVGLMLSYRSSSSSASQKKQRGRDLQADIVFLYRKDGIMEDRSSQA